jgi:hypothetical protein
MPDGFAELISLDMIINKFCLSQKFDQHFYSQPDEIPFNKVSSKIMRKLFRQTANEKKGFLGFIPNRYVPKMFTFMRRVV